VGTEENQTETSGSLSCGGGKMDDRKKKDCVYVTGHASHAGRNSMGFTIIE
jgi:hypothetical protein